MAMTNLIEVNHLVKNLKDRDLFINGRWAGRIIRSVDSGTCCKELRAVSCQNNFDGANDIGIAAYWMDY